MKHTNGAAITSRTLLPLDSGDANIVDSKLFLAFLLGYPEVGVLFLNDVM
jgi:hypothetical protein